MTKRYRLVIGRRRAEVDVWTRRVYGIFWCVIALAFFAAPAHAQVPLSAVDGDTDVSRISFNFVDGNVFDKSTLEDQIWHRDPGPLDRVLFFLPFVSMPEFPFQPVELQRDVVRLRRYYERNGYLHPSIDYPASQVDTSANEIHIVFAIRRGPPLIIQDVGFLQPDGAYAADLFESAFRDKWIVFRDRVTLNAGARYSEFEGVRLQDEVLTWLKDEGFAFASVDRETDIDSTANTVDLRFIVDPGPRGYISEIQIEGNESVDREVVLRQLPLQVGDRFSAKQLTRGQQDLFSLGLFRVALADVPEQPRDSTVVVRYRLREAQPRFLTAQTGYALEEGANVRGEWMHRNFFGGARKLTVDGALSSGYGARRAGGLAATRQISGSVSLQQPYLFRRQLSGVFTPFYEWRDNPGQRNQFQEGGIRSSVIYTIYQYRTVTFQHRLVRSQPIQGEVLEFLPSGDRRNSEDLIPYYRNVFSLSANLGEVDDFINPRRGFLVRPLLEAGGQVFSFDEDVDYIKSRLEVVGYVPLGRGYNLTSRLYLGRIWPTGDSRDQTDDQNEFRFDRIRFYAGGSNDVRGWPNDLLGHKGPIQEVLVDSEGDPVAVDYAFEANGGLGKIAANVELVTPLPFFGPAWRGAAFLDMGQVFPTAESDSLVRKKEAQSRVEMNLRDIRFGVGGGIRYETLVGFIRLDLGYKINPTLYDLASASEIFRLEDPNVEFDEDMIEPNIWDRFRLHLSIGQTF